MSNSIEERVVSIKFNNAQFEAGVKTTLTSLDGLKKSLDFSGGVKALNDLDLAGKKVNVKFDNKGFSDSVQSTITTANSLKSSLKFDGAVKGLNDLDAAGKKINLKLDPTPFQMGAKGVIDAANTIKQNLNFESVQRGFGNLKTSAQNFSFQSLVTGSQTAYKALGDLDLAGKAVSFLPIENGAAKAQASISAMSVAGIAALASLAVKATTAGLEMGKSLIIDPAKSGLQEYETNLNSIQTIMANTQSKGSTLTDVNDALDELNAYSDKTIYNFSEMAKNIGTFTSAGVGLKESTTAIKGISNLAALSGSNSEQASTAMYQLSQAMSSGSVKLQDWNSVVNAGMGGEVFQNALKETARNQGKNVDGLIAKNGSFRESLQEGWLTDKVMLETLSKMTGDLNDEQLRQMGYSDDQIAKIQQTAKTAADAATKIKTFTQLTGTLNEQTGSGWSTTWKLILGDFEQAKTMWTNVYNAVGPLMQKSADARNKMLGDWNKLGGRDVMIDAVTNAFRGLMEILQPIGSAFRTVFPPTTGKQLYDITVAIRNFMVWLRPSQEQVNLIGGAFLLFFTILKIGVNIIKGVFTVISAFFKAFATGGESVAGSMKPLTDGLTALSKRIAESKAIENFFNALVKGATILGTVFGKAVPMIMGLAGAIYQFGYDISGYAMYGVSRFARIVAGFLVDGIKIAIQAFTNLGWAIKGIVEDLNGGFDIAMTRIRERLASFGRLGDFLVHAWDMAKEAGIRFWDKIAPLRNAIADTFKSVGDQLKAVFSDVNFNDTLDMVNTGLLAGLFLIFRNLFKKLLGMGDGVKEGLFKRLDTGVESINKVLEGLTGTLEAMQQNLKADTLIKIAIAIGILAISVIALSMVDSAKLLKGLTAVGVMVVILSQAMKALDKISTTSGFLKIPVIAASMILLAIALGLLILPVVILAHLGWNQLIKGLGGVAVLLWALSKATESMAKNPADLIATGVGLMAIAVAVRILADAVTVMGKLKFDELVKGLGGIVVVLFALTQTVKSMSKNPADLIATGVSLIAIAVGVKILASAVSDFGKMDIPTLVKGIVSLGIVLTMLQVFSKTVGEPTDIIKTAIAMVILGGAMKLMASALGDFGKMKWEEIGKGLTVLAVALTVMSTAMARVPPNMLTSAIGFIAVAGAMKLLASALKDMGGMSWEEIGKSLVVLAASMMILSNAMVIMALAKEGVIAMLAVAAAVAILVPPLIALSHLSWDQLLVGLAALAGVFVIFGLAGLLLAPIAPIILALGIAMSLFGLGLMAVGIGTVIFIAGMIALTAAAIALGPAMTIVIMSILALIPMAMAELGKGIVAFADVIGGAGPTFLNAFVVLLNTLLTAIDTVFPNIMNTLWILIEGLVMLVLRAVPLFVNAGMSIITSILQGIGDNMGDLVDAAAKVITEFLDGIARNIGKIIESGTNLIIKFIEGMAKSVRENSERMANAGADLAGAVIDGMVNGLAKMGERVIGSIGRIGGDMLGEMGRVLGIHSPSREFKALGIFSMLGMALGVTSEGVGVVRAVTNVGKSALDALKNTMTNIGDHVAGTMDTSPVIRPVLDLSAIKRDSGLLTGMFKTPKLALDATYANAAALIAANRSNKEQQAANSNSDPVAPVTNVTYVQNNTSPKALSEIEIYRKTKNQLSTLKGDVVPA